MSQKIKVLLVDDHPLVREGLVQVVALLGHVHPAPLIDTSVKPVGTVSVTVTAPR